MPHLLKSLLEIGFHLIVTYLVTDACWGCTPRHFSMCHIHQSNGRISAIDSKHFVKECLLLGTCKRKVPFFRFNTITTKILVMVINNRYNGTILPSLYRLVK